MPRITSIASISSFVTARGAPDWKRVFDIENPSKDSGDNFGGQSTDLAGRGIDIYGTKAIISAYNDDTTTPGGGQAYIYDTTTGNLLHTLANPNADSTQNNIDWFGYSVSIHDNFAIVGAVREDAASSDAGAVYVFNVSTGALIHTILPPSGDSYFGNSVCLTADSNNNNLCAIIGAYQSNVVQGRVYIYDISGSSPSLLRTLNNPNSETSSTFDQFGTALWADGGYTSSGRLIVGAPREDNPYTDSGTVYIYNISTGSLLHTIHNPNPDGTTNSSDFFGTQVHMTGDRAIVSATREDEVGQNDSGKAFIIDVSTGNILHTLDNPNESDNAALDNFGSAVWISDGIAAVGAPGDTPSGSVSGTLYLFDISTGDLIKTIVNPDYNPNSNPLIGNASDRFGNGVAIEGDTMIIASPGEIDWNASPTTINAYGMVHIYKYS